MVRSTTICFGEGHSCPHDQRAAQEERTLDIPDLTWLGIGNNRRPGCLQQQQQQQDKCGDTKHVGFQLSLSSKTKIAFRSPGRCSLRVRPGPMMSVLGLGGSAWGVPQTCIRAGNRVGTMRMGKKERHSGPIPFFCYLKRKGAGDTV
jgi:hypothetical protein